LLSSRWRACAQHALRADGVKRFQLAVALPDCHDPSITGTAVDGCDVGPWSWAGIQTLNVESVYTRTIERLFNRRKNMRLFVRRNLLGRMARNWCGFRGLVKLLRGRPACEMTSSRLLPNSEGGLRRIARLYSTGCRRSRHRRSRLGCRNFDLGYQEEVFGIWFSFLAPAGIPEDARKALVGAIEQVVKAPAVTARLASLGILQSYTTPDQTTAEIRAEFKRVGEMARKTGLVK